VGELQEAARAERLALLPVDRVLRREDARYTRVELAELSGLPLDFLSRLWRALGMADPGDDEVVFGEPDLEAVKLVAAFRAAGLDEDTLGLIGHVLGHGMTRLSETILQAVGEALLQAGDSEQTLGLRYAQAAEHLIPMLTPLLGYVLSVQFRDQVKRSFVKPTELSAGQFENAREVTVCFADLVGFTRLGERVAPDDLSSAGRRLTDMALSVARPPVRLVKTIGDAAMLVSPEPEPLVAAALALVAEAGRQREAMPALRVGIASCRAVPDSGDWFGAPINLASRVTDVARPASVLTTEAVRDAVQPSFSWSYAGRRRFKGIAGAVALYRVHST
jgi:adenylate cyclase